MVSGTQEHVAESRQYDYYGTIVFMGIVFMDTAFRT